MTKIKSKFLSYSEQDTADKLILPYLTKEYGFPSPSSLDYQAQHTLPTTLEAEGRYDGLYLSGGYPYAVLEAKRYAHDLSDADVEQARSYATSTFFDKPVPFLVVSNGRQHRLLKRTSTLDPKDGKLMYQPIPATDWAAITAEDPGEVRRLLGEDELVDVLLDFKKRAFNDIATIFRDPTSGKYDHARSPKLGDFLKRIVEDRKKFIGQTTKDEQTNIRFSIEAISLHFTTKILFIKLVEDLSTGTGTPRIVHTLFPRPEYDLIGGLFGFKVLNALRGREERRALRLFVTSRKFYRAMAQDIAKVSWQDIFRYGFNVHTARYGKLFKAENYDRFLPSEELLEDIHRRLIEIDIRSAVLYGPAATRSNVIGSIYERLIDDELRNSVGAVYTPDATMKFMVALGKGFLKRFRGKKVVEPACGSGHFYRQVYREYVDEVLAEQKASGEPLQHAAAHAEALGQIYGRDIDPFAVQLTLLGTFLEQLRDNVRPNEPGESLDHTKLWAANRSIDTQNSLDPITVDADLYFDIEKTLDLSGAMSRRASCLRAANPDLIIGNPPYGVSVVEGAHYSDIYDLGSRDSYGYFIVNALKRLPEGGRVIFIVSSSFLTIKTHYKLRKTILDTAKIIRIVKLNRQTFPGIDIFPVIIELEKSAKRAVRDANVYQFYDLWQLHAELNDAELSEVYKAILKDLGAKKPWPFPITRVGRYTVRQGVIQSFSRLPIFEARPSLYEFMQDVFATPPPEKAVPTIGGKPRQLRVAAVRGRDVVKLSDIAEVKIGLQAGDNSKFYRAASGVSGGAAKGGYQAVEAHKILNDAALNALSAKEKASGIEVDDPSSDRYFVPLDKAGKADIEGGLLAVFWRPVEFYIDWSEVAVAEIRAHPQAVFRNPQYYFRKGVSFSNTGIYSPTFRLSHGGVFDQTGSCIFSDVLTPEQLLALLGSTLLKYFVKSFINHGVHAQLDDLPIVLPTTHERAALEATVGEIVSAQKADPKFDYRAKLAELDEIVFDVYQINSDERQEVQTWYRRHYPNLFS